MSEAIEDLDSESVVEDKVDDTAADKVDDVTDDDDLAVEVEHGGQKVRMAPVSKLIAHRKASRDNAARATTAEAENATLKAQLEKVNGDVAKIAPLLQALHARPDLVDHLKAGTKPSSVDHPANTDADPKMVELAKDWELFDADGKPDAARAIRIYKNIADPIKAAAEKSASDKVKPFADAQVQAKANQNKGILYEWAKAGHCTKEGVDKAIAMMPGGESLIADDGVRDVIYFIARGMNPAQAAKAAGVSEATADAVVHTEAAGGRGKGPTSLPAFSKAIAARRGKTEAEWAKLRDNDSDVLE